MIELTTQDMQKMANAIRIISMDAIERANSGHPGLPLGFADVATVLYTKFLKFNANDLNWQNRDRFILSAGHGSMLQYSLSYLLGGQGLNLDDIKAFRRLGSKTPGHPEYGHTKGVEVTTGPLGQGIANAVGFALGQKVSQARFGADLVNHKTYVVVGDGCLMEGISQEAISLGGHLKLGGLIVLWDDNEISIDGAIKITSSEDQRARFRAAGWNVLTCDGHNFSDVERALEQAQNSDIPTMIACKTTIGKGSPNKQGSEKCHGSPLGKDEIKLTKQALNCMGEDFEVDQQTLANWRAVGERGKQQWQNWNHKLDGNKRKNEFLEAMDNKSTLDAEKIKLGIEKIKKQTSEQQPKIATRKASQLVLDELFCHLPNLIGGSADLTGSNLTFAKGMKIISSDNYKGNYINYGVREHAMGAVMNALALYGGIVPYAGTFLAFADYMRPAIRLSALMGIRAIFVMTHDSIGLGEDGPTHQPVEQVASLRIIPNLNVFRPADLAETAECWQIALNNINVPSVLVLTRQALPTMRTQYNSENLSMKGGYICGGDANSRTATIIATGSEVALALEARQCLAEQNIEVAVVSMPCFELFESMSDEYKKSVLGDSPRVGVEALSSALWSTALRKKDKFIGMSDFGASAPSEDLYKHFNITVSNIVESVKQLIKT